jgi:HD-GYP domain-containing protein (c-di-GMP phosphodiesterase class II)
MWAGTQVARDRGRSLQVSVQPARQELGARSDWVLLGSVVLLPTFLFVALQAVPGLDVLFKSLLFHIIVVSLVSGCALLVALMAGWAAARARQPAVVLLAIGCLYVGFLMLTHGLTTPIVANRPLNTWVGRAPNLAIAAFAFFTAAATARPHHRRSRFIGRYPIGTLLVAAIVGGVACAAIVIRPSAAMGSTPLSHETGLTQALAVLSGITLIVTALTYFRRWQLSRDRVQLALTLACFLAAEALVSLQLGKLWRVSWWDYHGLLLTGFASAVAAVFMEYRRSRTIEGALSTIFLSDPLENIAHGYPEALKALVAAVEAKDVYTHGHSARVAEMSVRIGLRMGLKPATLRRLAQGALLHDIGKIGVPDQILNKPGSLTDEEWFWIKQHPVMGAEIVRQAPSLHHAIPAIQHHHERLDGQGYPDQLEGDHIPLEARIVAVADVWDAIRSDRAYRPAWPIQEALDHMVAGRGFHFDPRCLDAFLSVLADEGVHPGGQQGDVAEVLRAAEECHGVKESLAVAPGNAASINP